MLTRRRFLTGSAATAGAAILAACGGGSSATSTVAPTKAAATSAAASAPAAVSTTAPTAAASAASATTGVATAAVASVVQPAGTAASGSPAASAVAQTGKVKGQIDTTGIKKGGTIIVRAGGDITAFNPVTESNVITNSQMSLLYDSLVFPDPDTLQPTPNLATKWEVSPDSKTFTFTLKPGVKWHDGQPFTADDVKFAYELFMNPDSGSIRAASLSQNIASVTVKDPQTVVFTLKDVVASFMTIDAAYGIVPKHLLDSIAPKDFKTGEFSTRKPVGTGPFKFKQQILGDRVEFTANPDYHRGAPALDAYVYKVVKENAVTAQQLKTGELDFASISQDFADDAKKQANLNVTDYDTFTMLIQGYNVDPAKGPAIFQDVTVRQALCYAIDRQAIAQKIYGGYATVAVGTESPVTWAYQPDKITTKYEYDPKKAMQLLDGGGWKVGSDGVRAKDGKRLAFTLYTVSGDPGSASHMQVVQDAWKTIGVAMQLQLEEPTLVVNRASKSFDYEMFFFGLTTTPEPDQTRYWASNQHGPGANYYGYNNPKVDDLLMQGIRTLDVEQRKAIYVQAQNLIVADVPGFVSHFVKGIGAVNKRVKNLIPNAINTNFNAHQWYVTDGK
jgi:peptide/nickel transport system substrate-binding protein